LCEIICPSNGIRAICATGHSFLFGMSICTLDSSLSGITPLKAFMALNTLTIQDIEFGFHSLLLYDCLVCEIIYPPNLITLVCTTKRYFLSCVPNGTHNCSSGSITLHKAFMWTPTIHDPEFGFHGRYLSGRCITQAVFGIKFPAFTRYS
jgi:hypothetical protein